MKQITQYKNALPVKDMNNKQQYDAKKQSLIQQILSYRRRVSEYQILEKQVKDVSFTIQKTSTLPRSLSNQKLPNNKPISHKKINEDLNSSFKKQQMQRRISSSKKIRIYQLQKKLYRLGKEQNQKFTGLIFDKRELQVTQQTFKHLSDQVNQEEKRKKSLIEEKQKISYVISEVCLKFEQTMKKMEMIDVRKQMFEEEKQKILKRIENQNRMIFSIKNQSPNQLKNQNLEQGQNQQQEIKDQEQELNNQKQQLMKIKQQGCRKQFIKFQQKEQKNQQQDRQSLRRKVRIGGKIYEVIESKSSVSIQEGMGSVQNMNSMKEEVPISMIGQKDEIRCNKGNKIEKRQFAQKPNQFQSYQNNQNNKEATSTQPTDPYPYQNTFHHQQFQRPSFQQKDNPKLNKLNKLNLINSQQSKPNHQWKLNQIQNQLQLQQNINSQLNNTISIIQQQIISIQTQTKHHSTSLNLLKTKLCSYSQFIQREKLKQLSKISTIQQLHAFLSQKQGYRGQIRGRIGTKVEQQTLLKMLNFTLKNDLQALTLKIHSLIAYKNMLSHQIIQNIP